MMRTDEHAYITINLLYNNSYYYYCITQKYRLHLVRVEINNFISILFITRLLLLRIYLRPLRSSHRCRRVAALTTI